MGMMQQGAIRFDPKDVHELYESYFPKIPYVDSMIAASRERVFTELSNEVVDHKGAVIMMCGLKWEGSKGHV